MGGLAASGGGGTEEPPAVPAFEGRPAGTFVVLEGEPTAIAIPKIPGGLRGAGSTRRSFSEESRGVVYLEGDGTGRLSAVAGQAISLREAVRSVSRRCPPPRAGSRTGSSW